MANYYDAGCSICRVSDDYEEIIFSRCDDDDDDNGNDEPRMMMMMMVMNQACAIPVQPNAEKGRR